MSWGSGQGGLEVGSGQVGGWVKVRELWGMGSVMGGGPGAGMGGGGPRWGWVIGMGAGLGSGELGVDGQGFGMTS